MLHWNTDRTAPVFRLRRRDPFNIGKGVEKKCAHTFNGTPELIQLQLISSLLKVSLHIYKQPHLSDGYRCAVHGHLIHRYRKCWERKFVTELSTVRCWAPKTHFCQVGVHRLIESGFDHTFDPFIHNPFIHRNHLFSIVDLVNTIVTTTLECYADINVNK